MIKVEITSKVQQQNDNEYTELTWFKMIYFECMQNKIKQATNYNK